MIILGILLLLLIIGGILWSAGFSFFPDPELSQMEEVLRNICAQALPGTLDNKDLVIKRGKSFYTKDRQVIYLCLTTDMSFEVKLRRSIHEVAHFLNKDASEHGTMFTEIENQLLQKCLELGHQVAEMEINDCLTVMKEDDSEERASRGRLNYSMSFDPKLVW